jgi:transposase
MRFMIYEQTLMAKVLIGFMSRLIQGQPKKIFLILDDLKVRRSQAVRIGLEARRDRIEVAYLPAYSPELNPGERLNSDLKGLLHARQPAKTKAELKRKARSRLRRLQKRRDHIRRYFKHPKITYAAAT